MPASPPTSTQQGCPPTAAPHASRRADSSAERPTKAVAPQSLPTPALSRRTGQHGTPAAHASVIMVIRLPHRRHSP